MIWESLTNFRKENVKNSEEALKKILSWGGSISKFDYFVEREKKYSFGIGKGVILYKEQRDREEAKLYMLVPSIPVKYDSFDGVPISIFCFLSSPLNKALYLKYLSRFYRLINFTTFRENLLSMNSIEGVRKLIKREEESFEE
jgi:mannitol/fructose-specific phosphotransferase system IIA component (Ntr-type)